ncbi:hypothetical protein GOV14_04320 [Candidatus Pacearchaeota archaeon]|nr:hypothetical protein [Candidatus Pacearchaeota archaeon]
MVFEINQTNNPKLDEAYEKSMKELDSFFKLGWKYNRPNLVLVPDRKTINSLKGKETPEWVVGWTQGNTVYLLSDKNYETQSNHKYSDDEYFALLKHELAHCFSHIISKFSQKPIWLLEGLSIYLSGQLKLRTKPGKYSKFLEFYENGGKGVYSESGFAVEFLVKKYGKEKVIQLLKKAKESKSKEDFADLFKSIYDFELNYNNFEVL